MAGKNPSGMFNPYASTGKEQYFPEREKYQKD
jgi:hypothetical protein